MVKKKAKKKTKKSPKRKTTVKKKKAAKKKVKAPKIPLEKQTGEKMLGVVDHFFHNIQVAGIRVKVPFKVGDTLHFKGHTTDFTQTIDSMQINHQNVEKVKKGDDIGMKVKSRVRDGDIVYLASAAKKQSVPLPAKISEQKFLKF